MTTYIVVADAARARIFTREALTLTEQESLVHAEGRLHEGDLVTDRPGADVHESNSTSARSSGEEGAASKHENELFAKQVANHLYNARVGNSLEKLIMVAPPKFLGLLRDKLDGPTQKLVIHTLSKDLSKASLTDIQTAVSDLR
ncbi:host attachment protein [Halomonas janggokensis]|jgi:protein required for attachment to host cells|uniref:Host attachment protein n=1 Tax=Vreelandella janggokensis TaxID=370767 RepID=A0ABT4IUT0_9GAMM|nr:MULTISPECIES: host attachment protein [Halomonas]MCW4150722.1 host attachment protein [Halomonas sp. 18H]MCZ0927411.1 host attachment protein [Halomonas janggokensis]MCZ0929919.1 host attachment protein [Halomonas janggokensis]QPL45992.1 host attachment protein [Halomonas sp. A40-4]